ncbi:MAG TPA: beta-ketoacyl-[acyl-carrier-protein] synthase family protein [Candidatus Krumholzibacteria bacterium]|nr:beta-ketoacyl-[acyl-carrier-protein] synthase family protein [Candidatus Krumholzibacteria bacterium]HPD71873.1 beta-ketoacyl-[acyl-carrier-protein] synthase family protein [Candidatus Krumholzibacteria bacterium]HRY41194.1 beta-ketoacyl-[acyl-carrier-protein] synthase family protein [Candidatus Krumholzibacteria bacterium]
MRDRSGVVITGVGVVTPLGDRLDALWTRLAAGESAARPWDDLAREEFRHTVACRIDGLDDGDGRGRALGVIAARQAVVAAGVVLPARTAVVVGSTMGESGSFERAGAGERLDLGGETCAAFPRAIAADLGLAGPCRAYGAACAAGNYALGAAADLLRRDEADVVLAGGVEPFSRIAMVGFSRSRAMSATGVCRPFDARRDGMVLGEGAAMFVLERERDARARAATPLAVVGALGLACDAHHPTAPRPDGEGIAAAFRDALAEQDLAPRDVDWVCAHGSGTLLSDAAEAEAMRTVFGDRQPALAGLKGAFGHALGAATAIEAAVCVAALARQTIPPTVGLAEPGYPLDLVREPRAARLRWVANAGYAFGGLDSVLLLGAA